MSFSSESKVIIYAITMTKIGILMIKATKYSQKNLIQKIRWVMLLRIKI